MPHDPAQARPQTFKRPRERKNENVNKINVPRIVWQKKGNKAGWGQRDEKTETTRTKLMKKKRKTDSYYKGYS